MNAVTGIFAANKALEKLGVKTETTLTPGVLTFDGDINGHEVADMAGDGSLFLVKVLDRAISKSELEGITVTGEDRVSGKKIEGYYSISELPTFDFGSGFMVDQYVFSTPEDVTDQGITIKKGTHVYCQLIDDGIVKYFVSEIHGVLMPTETTHPIDPKYLPDGGVGYEEKGFGVIYPETTLDMNVDGSGVDRYAIIDFVPETKPYEITIDGVTYQKTGGAIYPEGAPEGTVVAYLGNLAMYNWDGMLEVEDTDEDFLILYCPILFNMDVTVFYHKGEASTITVTIKGETTTIHPIDPKYLPEGVGGVPFIDLSDLEMTFNDPLYSSAMSEEQKAVFNAIDANCVIVRLTTGEFQSDVMLTRKISASADMVIWSGVFMTDYMYGVTVNPTAGMVGYAPYTPPSA